MKIMKDLLKCLEEKLKNASDELRVDIGIAISHFQDEEIQNFLTKCFEYVPVEKIRSRGFEYLMSEFSNGLVTDMVKLSMEDDGISPTDDDVIKQIGVRTKHIADQINNQQLPNGTIIYWTATTISGFSQHFEKYFFGFSG